MRDLLPRYARGALAGQELVFMNQWLESQVQHHPEIAAELAWLRSTASLLQGQVQADAQAPAARQASEAALGQLMQRIAQEWPSPAEDAARPVPSLNSGTGPGGRLSAWMAAWLERLGTLGLRPPVLALGAVAVLIVQAGVIGVLLNQAPAQQVLLSGATATSTAPSSSVGKVLLTVAFKPQATEQALRQALAAAQAQIVDGPSALGLYTLAVPGAQADAAAAQLRGATGVVESVQR